MIATQTAYLGRHNTIALYLLEDAVAISTENITRMDLIVGKENSVTLSSLNREGDPILWGQDGYATGEFRIVPRNTALIPRDSSYNAYLIVYSTAYPDGLYWDTIPLIVRDI